MNRNRTLATLLMLTTASGLAIAGPEKKNSDNKDLLRGPAVVDSTTTTNDDKQQDPMKEMEKIDFKAHPIALREITAAVRSLSGPQADEAIALTPEQGAQIKSIVANYRTEIQAFQEENAGTIQKLRAEMREQNANAREEAMKRRQGARDAMQEEDKEAASDRRAQQGNRASDKLREFIANSPPAKSALQQINDVLSDEQMNHIKENVTKMRHRAAQRGREGARQGRPGAEREPAIRGVDRDEVRPEQRRQRDRKDRNDKPIDD